MSDTHDSAICPAGHTAEDSKTSPSGRRYCRKCRRAHERKRKATRRHERKDGTTMTLTTCPDPVHRPPAEVRDGSPEAYRRWSQDRPQCPDCDVKRQDHDD